MRTAYITLLLLLVSFSGYCQYRPLRAQIQVLVDSLAEWDVLQGNSYGLNVVFPGEKKPDKVPIEWRTFQKLSKKATDDELIWLTDHKNAVVRCYAFDALLERKNLYLLPIVEKHKNDTATIFKRNGCLGEMLTVGSYISRRRYRIDTLQSSVPQGIYENHYSSKRETAPYRLIRIYKADDSTMLFYLEIGRGAPSYNSGAIYGRARYDKLRGILNYYPMYEDCQLEMTWYGSELIIKTVSGECMFGNGVVADGTYYLKSSENPEFFEDMHGKKVYFRETTPETYVR